MPDQPDVSKEIEKSALDLLIAVKQAAPAQQQGGPHGFLELTLEALVATAHFIIGAAAKVEGDEVQAAIKALAKAGRGTVKNTSLDDLLKLRKKLAK
jgi:hypothetical protein